MSLEHINLASLGARIKVNISLANNADEMKILIFDYEVFVQPRHSKETYTSDTREDDFIRTSSILICLDLYYSEPSVFTNASVKETLSFFRTLI